MPEYIEREALLKKNMYGNANPITQRTYAENLIKSAPAADVAEVKHGRWVYDHWCEFKCSVCGHFSNTNPRGKENYCPKCGAKTDQKEGVKSDL